GSEESRAEYARLLAEMVEKGLAGPPERKASDGGGVVGFTVVEAIAKWDEHAEKVYSVRGREKAQFKLAIEPLLRKFGRTPVAVSGRPEREELQDIRLVGGWMKEQDRDHRRRQGEGGGSRGVATRRIVKIRTIWRWLERKKIVKAGTWSELRTVKAIAKNRPG